MSGYANRVKTVVSKDISRTGSTLFSRFGVSLVVPLLVFVVLMVIGGYVRLWVASTYQSSSLDLTTGISTTLVILFGSWFVLRRVERRFHGWAALRHLTGVLTALSRLETLLNNDQDPDDVTRQAETTWQAYNEYLHVLGYEAPSLDSA